MFSAYGGEERVLGRNDDPALGIDDLDAEGFHEFGILPKHLGCDLKNLRGLGTITGHRVDLLSWWEGA